MHRASRPLLWMRRPLELNGSKIFITNAGYADVFIIIAVTGFVTDKRGRKQKEISAFIVERTDPRLQGRQARR